MKFDCSEVNHDELAMADSISDDQIDRLVAYDERLRLEQSQASPPESQQSQASQDALAFEVSNPELAKAVRALRDIFTPFTDECSLETRAGDLNTKFPAPDQKGLMIGLVSPERFQLIEHLGSGGFGIVHRAFDTWMKREVAIKFLRPELLGNATLRIRFLRESRAAARLNHPFIVRVWEASESPSSTWQVCELVNGAPLTEHIALTRIEPRLAARLIRDLADGVAHAHSCNVLHRDIKPDNILMDCLPGDDLASATLRLTDFGLARMTDLDETLLTCDGMLVGTPRYMAPEQLSGKVDGHGIGTDIYAMGVILFEMLAGHNPFEDFGSLQERMAHAHEPVTHLRRKDKSLPKDLAVICHKCLEFSPANRYPTAAQLRDDLDRFLRGDPTLARPLPVHEQLWRWSVRHRVAAGFLGLLFLAASVILALTLRNNWNYRQQNLELSRVNDQLASNEMHAHQLAEIADQLRLDATTKQERFADLAWRKGIREAYTAWQRRDLVEAQEMMDKLVESHSDAKERLEWRLLRAELDKHVKVLLKLPVAIHEVRAIPNSRRVAAAAGDGAVYIIEAASGETIHKIDSGVRSLHALAISPDGRMLATGGVTDEMDLSHPSIYDVETGTLIKRLPGQPTTIESLVFGADSQTLVCGCRYEDAVIFQIESGKFKTIPAASRHLGLSVKPQTNRLVARHGIDMLSIQNLGDMEEPTKHVTRAVSGVAWLHSSDALLLATPSHIGTSIVTTEQVERKFSLGTVSQDDETHSLVVHDKYIAAGFLSGEVIIWLDEPMFNDAIAPYASWRLAPKMIDSIDISEGYLYAGSQSGELISVRIPETRHVLPSTRWTPIEAHIGDGQHARDVAWSGSGTEVLAGSWNCAIAHLSLGRSAASMQEQPHANESIEITARQVLLPSLGADWMNDNVEVAVEFSPDRRLWAAARANQLAVYAAVEPGPNPLYQASMIGGSPFVKFSPDSRKLAWTADRALHVAALDHPEQPPMRFSLKGHGICAAWASDSQKIAVGGQFATIEIDISDGTYVELDHGIQAACVAYSPDGELISGHRDGTIRTLNPQSLQVCVMKVHNTDVCSLLIQPGSNIGISLDSRANLGVWYTNGEAIGMIQSDSDAYFASSCMVPKAFVDPKQCVRVLSNDADYKLKIDTWLLK